MEGLLALLSLAVIIPLALLPRLQTVVASNADPAAFDALLFGLAAAVGVGTGTLGFVFSRISGEPAASFLAGAFVNLGCGLAGAAAAFVLFQSLLARRAVRADDVKALSGKIAQLRESLLARIDDIRMDLDRISTAPAHGTALRPPARSSGIIQAVRQILDRLARGR